MSRPALSDEGTDACWERLVWREVTGAALAFSCLSLASLCHVTRAWERNRVMFTVLCQCLTMLLICLTVRGFRLGLVRISLSYISLHAFFSRPRIPCKGNVSYLGCLLGSVQLILWFLSVCFLFFHFLNAAEFCPRTLRGGGLDRN